MAGKLYLIPTTLGNSGIDVLPPSTLAALHKIKVFIVERGKTARRFIKETKHPTPLQEMTYFELNKRTQPQDYERFLLPAIQEGKDIGIISEAGCPSVADPGANIIRLAHQKGIAVHPLVGPSSILLALMASGMNGQQFAFHGYLPIKTAARKKALTRLQKDSRKHKQTQIFMETPYRNEALVKDALSCLHNETLFGIAADITLPSQYIHTQTIRAWKQQKDRPSLHKRPTIFLLLA